MRVQSVKPDQIVDLRHQVLRQGLPRESAVFPGDDDETSRHYGAFDGDRLIGCATLHLNQWEQRPAWQLRGMAVASDAQARGVGRALLEFLEADVYRSAVRSMWCNARVPASGFYRKLGWRIVSEVFEIPTAGPHVKMVRDADRPRG